MAKTNKAAQAAPPEGLVELADGSERLDLYEWSENNPVKLMITDVRKVNTRFGDSFIADATLEDGERYSFWLRGTLLRLFKQGKLPVRVKSVFNYVGQVKNGRFDVHTWKVYVDPAVSRALLRQTAETSSGKSQQADEIPF